MTDLHKWFPKPIAERNVLKEMRELIKLKTSSGAFVAAVAAHEIVDWLREYEPELLQQWLNLLAPTFVREAITRQLAAERTYNRGHSPRAKFAQAIADHEAGDDAELIGWLETSYVVDEQRTRRQLGDMTSSEVNYVAQGYRASGKRDLLAAEFLFAISRKFIEGTVSDHFDNIVLDRLWKSLAHQ